MNAPDRSPPLEQHGPSLATMLVIFGALLTLTGATVIAAYHDLGRLSAPVALGIAAAKGTLVALYFMHLRYGTRLVALYATAGLAFLAILLGLTMSEVAGRPAPPAVDPLRPGRPAMGTTRGIIDEEPP